MRGLVEQREATLGGKPRFGAAVDDFELQPYLVPHAIEKHFAILRDPASLCRDKPHTRHRAQVEFLGADAPMARAIAASPSLPLWPTPSPSRTMREKESTTRNVSPVGSAISRRQLLVPRSSAA
jgi:hypothetical protein